MLRQVNLRCAIVQVRGPFHTCIHCFVRQRNAISCFDRIKKITGELSGSHGDKIVHVGFSGFQCRVDMYVDADVSEEHLLYLQG
jgi:hypothetical protein